MNLPEIPDEALLIAEGAVNHTIHGDYRVGSRCSGLAVEAAWPHLYAAALRHAGTHLLDEDCEPDKPDWSAREVAKVLDIWADWATSNGTA